MKGNPEKKVIPKAELITRLEEYIKGIGGIEHACIIATTSVPYFFGLWWGFTIRQSLVNRHEFLVVSPYVCSNLDYELSCLVIEKFLLSDLRVSHVHSRLEFDIRIFTF